ncbi:MAG: phosphate ABC transporter substrate-binding protein [Planctomycetota bacterium]
MLHLRKKSHLDKLRRRLSGWAAASLCLMFVVTVLLSGCSSERSGEAASHGQSSTSTEDVESNATPAGLSGKLVLTGSSTVAPLAAEIGRRFEVEHPDVRVDVQTGGSSRGIADALSGVADLGMASRALKPDEEQQGLVSHAIAIDGVSIIVNAGNPVTDLTKSDVVALFTGEITNWSAVGGSDVDVVVVNKAEGRATLEVFLQHFELNNEDIQADVVVGDNQHGIKTVAGNPLAIGYVSIGAAQSEAEQGTPLRLVPVDGIRPTAQNVASGKFPVTRPLLLLSKGQPMGLAAAFVEFAKTAQVHDLIKAQGFEAVAR